jgi:hypothetical protein
MMAWLDTWQKRIKLTIDQTKIDTADLTWFPVTVFLTATAGEEVFTELDADADYMKVAFTKDDGTTELYAECELFDVSEQKAIYHISKDGWVISNTVDTDFYMYYDNDHADNTDYIGAIDTTAGGNVWDTNFKAVHHLKDATTSTVKDSTANNNDGAKQAANEPIETDGKVGKAQDFDGSNDYILTAGQITDWTKDFTISGWIKPDVVNIEQALMGYGHGNETPYYSWAAYLNLTHFMFTAYNGTNRTITSDYTAQANVGFYVTIVYDGDSSSNNASIYINGALDKTGTVITELRTDAYNRISIGASWNGTNRFMNGVIDEVRISNVTRTADWIKATYNSLFDTLLTYGSEEILITFIPQIIFI